MELFGIAFGIFECAFAVIFLLAMAAATFMDRADRYDEPSPKWIVSIIGVCGVLYLTRNLWTLDALPQFFISKDFWIPLLKYLGLGLIYAIVEFAFAIRTSKRNLGEAWEKHLNSTVDFKSRGALDGFEGSVRSLYEAENLGHNESIKFWANRSREDFVEKVCRKIFAVRIKINSDKIEPSIDKGYVYDNVFVWVLMWPFYAMSLIFGEFLMDALNAFSRALVKFGDQVVKVTFKDMFKL